MSSLFKNWCVRMCYGLHSVPPKFICWCRKPWIGSIWRQGLRKGNEGYMGRKGEALIWHGWWPYRKRKGSQSPLPVRAQKKGHVGPQWEGSHPSVSQREGSDWRPTPAALQSALPAPRTARRKFLWFKPPGPRYLAMATWTDCYRLHAGLQSVKKGERGKKGGKLF